ncbi:MAG: DUF2442 domain-containing protein [Blastocatellia bacterium]|nr:DUF2442 domain-containing protein [Blastocatellia bacterium]
MPTVLNNEGYKLMIYTRDHEPMHVHVLRQNSKAVIEFETLVRVRSNRGLNRRELRQETRLENGKKFMDKIEKDNVMSEKEFERQFQEATRRGAEELKRLRKAVSAKYDKRTQRILLEMGNGVTLLVPVSLVQGLKSGDEKKLSDFDLMYDGSEIHWHALDVQFYVEDFLRGIFGTPKWMSSLKEHLSEIGRKGGSARSIAKRISSAENGKKGGRPRTKRTA